VPELHLVRVDSEQAAFLGGPTAAVCSGRSRVSISWVAIADEAAALPGAERYLSQLAEQSVAVLVAAALAGH
jgi:hypothetical protein